MQGEDKGLNLYKKSGVDVEKGDALVDWLKEDAASERRRSNQAGELVEGIGGFSGLFRPNFVGMKDPVLVASTDGVGTKLLLAIEEDYLEGVGIDLVAMCANDLFCIGARPMFFLDYYATGVLSSDQFKRVLVGIKHGLKLCDTPLLGGETAELPGLYEKGHFDLAGFIVGAVDNDKKLGPHLVKAGDKLYALASSGFHSNGYSLVRRWIKERPVDKATIQKLLEPTKIYGKIPDMLHQLGHGKVHAIANITGGGISGNLPRVIPQNLRCEIAVGKLPIPAWMSQFIKDNDSTVLEVESVFNIGAGMIVAVDAESAKEFETVSARFDFGPKEIGVVKSRNQNEPEVGFV